MSGLTYKVPDLAEGEVFRVEQTIKKSRFIASVGHTPTVESAKAFIEKLKQNFRTRDTIAGPIVRAQRARPHRSEQATTESRTALPADPCSQF